MVMRAADAAHVPGSTWRFVPDFVGEALPIAAGIA
jgi:hypothetical protein